MALIGRSRRIKSRSASRAKKRSLLSGFKLFKSKPASRVKRSSNVQRKAARRHKPMSSRLVKRTTPRKITNRGIRRGR